MQKTAPNITLASDAVACWESRNFRLGFEEIRTRITQPSAAARQLIKQLQSGITATELAKLTKTTAEFAELLRALRPALQTAQAHPENVRPAIKTRICDDGREIPGLRSALENNYLCDCSRNTSPPELVVQVLRFIEPIERTRRWLARGIPQLLVRFTDSAVKIGPLIAAHGNPCHNCETMHLVAGDPELPFIAAQLYGQQPASETPQICQVVSAIAASYLHAWQAGANRVHTEQVRITVAGGLATGHSSITQIKPHPECACTLSEQRPPPPQNARGL